MYSLGGSGMMGGGHGAQHLHPLNSQLLAGATGQGIIV